MSPLNLPATWSAMTFYAKANYLVDTFQVRSFEEACSMLARRRRAPIKPRKLGAGLAREAVANLWWNR